MTEAEVQQAIRLALGRAKDVKLFRNNCGVLPDRQGRPIRFGLFPGSGDLIGWRTVVITPEMVGSHVAVFASVEVKGPKGVTSSEQAAWRDAVQAGGGLAGVVRNEAEARVMLGLPE